MTYIYVVGTERVKRRYKKEVVEDAVKRLEEVDRDTALLKVERKKRGRRPVLATTY